jgi:acetoin utilization protein AcuB
MQVRRIMTKIPYTALPGDSVVLAQSTMKREKVHRLPVVDEGGRLLGIVSEKDLLNVSPSPASTLDVYEMSSLLQNLKVQEIMTRDVKSVHPDTLIEDAARLMADNDIGGLPVVGSSGVLEGIITESDVFKAFIELFGGRKTGLRLSLLVPEKQGELADLTSALSKHGANIISLSTYPGEDASNSLIILKVSGIDKDKCLEYIKDLVIEAVDVREV